MRPLTVTAEDRVAPPRKSVSKSGRKPAAKPARGKTTAGRRSKAVRRKPLPTWFRPAAYAAAIVLVLASFTGVGFWIWTSGFVNATSDRANRTVERAVAGLGLTVREVTVSGRQRTQVADILRAVGAGRGDNIFSVDLNATRERLEALGWVSKAAVERRFPDTLHIRLEERNPFALWQHKGVIRLIDREGVPITGKGLVRYRGLVNVIGKNAGRQAAELFEALRSEPALMKRVRSASLIRSRRWDVTFANGVKVRLPEEGVPAAWRKLASLERQHAILGRDLVAVDMRVADRLVVRLTPDAAAARRRPGKST